MLQVLLLVILVSSSFCLYIDARTLTHTPATQAQLAHERALSRFGRECAEVWAEGRDPLLEPSSAAALCLQERGSVWRKQHRARLNMVKKTPSNDAHG